MTWLVAITVGITSACGVYLALSRDGLRCLVGLSIVGSAVNLMLFASGRLTSPVPPVIPATATELGVAANPLPQALVLTAIVIGLALVCFGMVLLLGIVRQTGTDDLLRLRFAEPVPQDPVKPPLSGKLDSESNPEQGQIL